MNKISVCVSGASHTGKSTVAAIIALALAEHFPDFPDIAVIDDNGNDFVEESPEYVELTLASRIASMQNRVKIEVCTRQAIKRCPTE